MKTLLLILPTLIALGPPAVAETVFPREFQGLWVDETEHDCPVLTKDEDAYGMGEGALLLRGNKFYSHESLCRITGKVVKSCCDQTIATNYSCGGRYRGRVLLHLRPFAGGMMLIESWENAASGPVIKAYRKKC